MNWTSVGILGGALLPLLGVPLAMVWHYLKGLHDYHVKRGDDLLARMTQLSNDVAGLNKVVREFERRYTTREDWARELAQSRMQIQRLTDGVTALQLELRNGNGVGRQIAELSRAVLRLAEKSSG